jgi:hypothetical protein
MVLDCDGHDLDVGEGEKALFEKSGLRGMEEREIRTSKTEQMGGLWKEGPQACAKGPSRGDGRLVGWDRVGRGSGLRKGPTEVVERRRVRLMGDGDDRCGRVRRKWCR